MACRADVWSCRQSCICFLLPQIVLYRSLLTRKFNILSLYITFVIKSLLNKHIIPFHSPPPFLFLITNWLYILSIFFLLTPQNRFFFWLQFYLDLNQVQKFDVGFYKQSWEYREGGEMSVRICCFPLHQNIFVTVFLDGILVFFFFFLLFSFTQTLLSLSRRELSHHPDPDWNWKEKLSLSCRKLPAAFNLHAGVMPCFCCSCECFATSSFPGSLQLLQLLGCGINQLLLTDKHRKQRPLRAHCHLQAETN